jgi:hypothetical protein
LTKSHYVCLGCGMILDCDEMGITLDESDVCEHYDDGLHYAKKKDCECLI